LWNACNHTVISRSGYGGGSHAFSGLVSCGACGATMSVSTGGNSHTLSCASCGVARRVGADVPSRGTLSVTGLKHAIEDAIQSLFTEPVIKEFHARLRSKLNQGVDEELYAASVELERLKRIRERMTRMLRIVDADDDALIKEYQLARDEYLRQKNKVDALKGRMTRINKHDLERQMDVDPKHLVPQIWSADVDSATLRSLLSRLFSEIVFEGRLGKFQAQVKITVSPGVVAAILTDTGLIDATTVTWRYTITSGASRPTKWHVQRQRDRSVSEGKEPDLPHHRSVAG
jgi:site-specific DNA recombinase